MERDADQTANPTLGGRTRGRGRNGGGTSGRGGEASGSASASVASSKKKCKRTSAVWEHFNTFEDVDNNACRASGNPTGHGQASSARSPSMGNVRVGSGSPNFRAFRVRSLGKNSDFSLVTGGPSKVSALGVKNKEGCVKSRPIEIDNVF
ncbi:hypothetical protein L484_008797 [Morus notabilis]|uniref:Uncharacterized protein n=1 Tax=Morus notabilis TaxID=981085 RepID=W9QZG7_9ROSA|nr:hypothetical protein L484_008797 [Morus notabilis]